MLVDAICQLSTENIKSSKVSSEDIEDTLLLPV